MDYLLFITYLAFFCWLTTKIKFFRATGLSRGQLIILFLLKVIAGIFYGWMGIYYGDTAHLNDTWAYHQNGLIEFNILRTNPGEYFTNLFHNPYENGLSNFFGSTDSYWNDLKSNIFIKLVSVFDIFSFGSYYINVIFYAFITLFGPIAFFRICKHAFPGNDFLLIFCCFLVPSFYYWAGGLHKEGLLFTGIALSSFHVYFAIVERRLSFKRILGVLLGLFIILVLRNFVLLVLIPALAAFIFGSLLKRRGYLVFPAVYLIGIILFFTLKYLHPALDFPAAVVSKQQAFLQLKGQSSVQILELEPNAGSFLLNMPQTISLSLLRPYPSDIHHLFSLAAAIEVLLILILFVLMLIFRKKPAGNNLLLSLYFLAFIIGLLLSIGFSVNNLGAIVRYRSLAWPMLLVLICVHTDWQRMQQWLKKL